MEKNTKGQWLVSFGWVFFTYGQVFFTYGWSLLLTEIGLVFLLTVKIRLGLFAYGGESVRFFFLLAVPPARKSDLVSFCLRLPHCK